MLVDSRALMREGLRTVMDQEPDLVVVAEAATVNDAGGIEIAADVIVTDVLLPDGEYGDVISRLLEFHPESSILVFTRIDDPAVVQSVLAAGGNGYLLETSPSIDLIAATRAVAGGETYLQPSLGAMLARPRSRDALLRLTRQEEQVFRLLVLGHTNVEVARLCNMSLRAAEAHRADIQRKLDRHTRAELVEYARESGLMQVGS